MKHNDPKKPQKKTFLRIPTFPGGKDAYQKFIKDNIVYPEQALSSKIEGSVYMVYTVNNSGEIVDVEVSKGIGSGCDEEAIRVIRLMKYDPARNRGVKMKVEMKTRINFIRKKYFFTTDHESIQLNYIFTKSNQLDSPKSKTQDSHSYILNIE